MTRRREHTVSLSVLAAMWPLGSAENSETSTLESLGEAWRPRACREAREGELGAREGQLGAQKGKLGAQEGQL